MRFELSGRPLCFAFFACWLLGGASSFIVADDAERPPTPPAAETVEEGASGDTTGTPETAEASAAGAAAGAATEAVPPVPGERIIYVPFSKLGDTLDQPDSSVVLPYAEYLKLKQQWEESRKPEQPVSVVLTQADYVGVVEKDFARLTLTLQAKVLGPAWSRIPIQFGAAAVGKVTGKDVLIRGTGEGAYELIFGQPGEQIVTIELGVPVSQSPDGRRFDFSCPPVAVQTIDITVPEAEQAIEIQPTGLREPVEQQPEQGTRAIVQTGSTQHIQVAWRARASQKPEMDLLASVTNRTLVTIGDGLIHTDTWLTYDVLRGRLAQFQIVVPADHRILDINANVRIKSWKPTERDGRQVVDVVLLAASDKPVTLDVHTQRKLGTDAFETIGLSEEGTTWGVHALDAVRESGQFAVRHSPDLTLNVLDQTGLIRIEQQSVDQQLAGDNALAFKFYSPRARLQLSAKPVEPRLTVTNSTAVIFTEDELRSESQFQYAVERTGIFGLQLQLPEDFQVDAVECPLMKEYTVDDATRRLNVTLAERHQGGLMLVVKGHREFDASMDSSEQVLPVVEPLNVERETGSVMVFAKDAIEVVTSTEGLAGAQPLPAPPQMRDQARLASAWSFTRRPLTIPVRTIRKPTRLSARVASTIDVQPEVTEVKHTVRFLVEYAGIDTFRVNVPEAVSDQVRIEVAPGSNVAIKQKTASDPVEDWVTWTIVMQREVLGEQAFELSWFVQSAEAETNEAGTAPADPEPTPADAAPNADVDADDANAADPNAATATANSDEDKPERLSLSLVRPLGMQNEDGEDTTPLSKVYGEVLITKERSVSLSTTAEGGEIEAIDLRELQLLPQEGTDAFRYFKLPETGTATLAITRTRHEIQEVVATVVPRALVEVVTDEDAEATYRCRMLVKSTERQRLLVHLPKDLQVLGVFVNNRDIKLERAEVADQQGMELWDHYWVNVARTGSSEDPFLLTFQFLWHLDHPLGRSQFGRGRLALPLPLLGGMGSGAAIQELKVCVWVPDDYVLVGNPDHFKLHQLRRYVDEVLLGSRPDRDAQSLESWIQQGVSQATGFLQFPTQGRQPYIYTNLGGAAQLRVVWWHRLTMTLLFSGAAALIGLILINTPWENKLGILLLAGFAAVLYGVNDSHGLFSGMQAAQYGLITLIGLWLIHGVFSVLKRFAPHATNGTATPTTQVAPPAPTHEPPRETESPPNPQIKSADGSATSHEQPTDDAPTDNDGSSDAVGEGNHE